MLALIASAYMLAAPAAPAEETRALRLVALDPKGHAVGDLTAHELAVMENGVARAVTRLVPDRRKITLALVVDTSASLSDGYRAFVVPAVESFLAKLPSGTSLTLWTSGSRPQRVVERTDDPGELSQALARVVPQGGNTLFDTLDEALAGLAAAEGQRSILVIVSATGPEFSARDASRVLDDPRRIGTAEVYSVELEEPLAVNEEANPEEGRSPMERRADYDRALDTLARTTGGRCERALSLIALSPALDLLATDIGAGYLLDYASVASLKERKLTVHVARGKVRVRFSQASRMD